MRAVQPWFIEASAALALLLGLSACSMPRPVLYPNPQYQRVGEAAARRDVDECLARARQFAKSDSRAAAQAREAARSGSYGAATGAAAGAVGGAIGGSAGMGAAIGAASGAVAGVLHAIFGGLFGRSGPDPVEANFTDRCLREKGYDPVGWK